MFRTITRLIFVLTILAAVAVPVLADGPIDDGLAWLQTQQQADGGFTNGFSEGSDLGTTCDVILAIAAGGQDASAWESDDGNSPLDYIYAQVTEDAVSTLGLQAKVTLALLATGQAPSDFAGSDLIAELGAAHNEATNSYGETVFDHALVMLALSAAGQPVADGSAQYLLDNEADDGAWALFGDTAAGAGDTNTTALAVQALVAVGSQDGIGDALAYFHAVQNDDGGFPYQNPSDYGTDTDANSTAVVLQALLAADESLDNWSPQGVSPMDALLALHDTDSGAFFWQAAMPGANALATAQAIPAVADYTFVVLPRVEAANPPGAADDTGDAEAAEAVVLPATGGMALLPVGVIALGIAALSAGIALRRR